MCVCQWCPVYPHRCFPRMALIVIMWSLVPPSGHIIECSCANGFPKLHYYYIACQHFRYAHVNSHDHEIINQVRQ